MRLFLSIFFFIATIRLNAQIEIPIHGAYDGGYGKDKLIKSDSAGWLFIPYSDTSKIIFIAKDYTTYKQFNKQNQLLVEGSFGGKKWVDYFQPYGKWTEYYENGSIKSTGFYYPYSYEAIGLWQYYYPNGQIRKSYSIEMVDLDSMTTFCKAGLYEEYYENGQLKITGWYGISLDTAFVDKMNYSTLSYEKVKGLKPVSKPIGIWKYYKPNGEIEKKD